MREGPFLDVPFEGEVIKDSAWWKGSKYCIGNMTSKKRKIKIVNTLTKHEDIIEVSFIFIFILLGSLRGNHL